MNRQAAGGEHPNFPLQWDAARLRFGMNVKGLDWAARGALGRSAAG